MRTFFRLLLSSFLFTSLLSAQQAPQPAGRSVTLRLVSFYSESANAELHAHDSKNPAKPIGVKTPLKNYLNHEVVDLILLGSELSFTNASAAPKAEEILGSVTLPASGSRFLLMFFPAAEKGKFQIMAVEDSLKAFPLGSFRVFNLSRSNIRLTLEKTNYDFKPGSSQVISDPPVQENMHSAMYAHAQVADQWQRIGSGLWPHPGKKRDLEFFFENPQTKQIELRGFRDISPPEKSAE